jgi:hypothetical protein
MLATAAAQRVVAAARRWVARVNITEAGQRALKGALS